jgi:hypothetical protein
MLSRRLYVYLQAYCIYLQGLYIGTHFNVNEGKKEKEDIW